MKACNNCGIALDDNANVCSNCGTPVQAVKRRRPAKNSISVGGWIGRSLIPYIPIAGGIVYLIMLFIWSGDTTKEDTFRNWAKAQLIFILVGVIITVLIAVLFGSTLIELLEYM